MEDYENNHRTLNQVDEESHHKKKESQTNKQRGVALSAKCSCTVGLLPQ